MELGPQPLAHLSLSQAMMGSLYSSSTDVALVTMAPAFSSTSRSVSSSRNLLTSCLMRPSWSWLSARNGDTLTL